jgi:hypothetical protein
VALLFSPHAQKTVFSTNQSISATCGTEQLFPFKVALTAPAPPVPTAATQQEHNQDDNQNCF